MVRKAASIILMTVFLCLGLTPLVTPAQIPVTDVAHIAINQMGWTATPDPVGQPAQLHAPAVPATRGHLHLGAARGRDPP